MRSPSIASSSTSLSSSPRQLTPLTWTPPSSGLVTPATELLTPPLETATTKRETFALPAEAQGLILSPPQVSKLGAAHAQLGAIALLERARGRATPARQAQIFAAFDAWAQQGQLEAGLSALRQRQNLPPTLSELLPLARVQSTPPLLVGHRGQATEAVENTIAGAAACFAHGADGVEIDLALVRGDAGGFDIILRHDTTPPQLTLDGLFTALRNVGLESLVYSQLPLVSYPRVPSLWQREMRKPSHMLKLSDYREHYGYVTKPGLDAHIPTFAEFTSFLGSNNHRDKLVFLDVKVPGNEPQLIDAMAERIALAVDGAGLSRDKFVVASFELAVLEQLRARLGSDYQYSLGSCLEGPFAKPAEARVLDDARASGAMAHVGHWFFGSDAALLKVIQRDARAMQAEGHKLGVWTVNDPLVFRKLLGAGTLSLVISDDPRVLKAAWQRIAG